MFSSDSDLLQDRYLLKDKLAPRTGLFFVYNLVSGMMTKKIQEDDSTQIPFLFLHCAV
jgi:hypothetical protein